MGKEGTVLLRLTIDERGRLIEAGVAKGAGFGFDEQALRAARESTFRPARRDGRPIMCRAILPIQFILEGPDHD
jgi:protein TonB